MRFRRDDLAYVRWNGSNWDREIVDGVGYVGAYSSPAFDAGGLPAISYYANCSGSLRIARYKPDCGEPAGSCPPGWGCACTASQDGGEVRCECVPLPATSPVNAESLDSVGLQSGF